MSRRPRARSRRGLALAVLAAGTALAAPASALARDVTSPLEAHRVDSVPTPALDWYDCYTYAQCTTAEVPLDYDHPDGPQVELGLLKVPATDPAHRIGTLFVNPGGPSGSAVQLAYAAPGFLGADVRARFDVVGIDPRGVFTSDNVRCFPSVRAQIPVMRPLAPIVPLGPQIGPYLSAAAAFGKACSTTGRPLTAHMSTAEVARDMDVMRRAVGDDRLTYLGFSYGTQLGQVYANMFPDRVRAMVIDGVVDSVGWAGTRATANVPSTARIRSGEGAWKALHELLLRCDRAGGQLCPFAPGDPVANFALIARRLKAKPLQLSDFEGGTFTFGYGELVGDVLGQLYDPAGADSIAGELSQLIILTEPPAAKASAAWRRTLQAFRTAYLKRRATAHHPRLDFPYGNDSDAFYGVLCTDSRNPSTVGAWPAAVAAADRAAPYFGAAWTWESAVCATRTWTVSDGDAWRGPWNRTTAYPVLVVGDYFDPATNYQSAVRTASRLPGARLLSSDSWGHTAYGTSACASDAVNAYLVDRTLPAKGTVCTGDYQPFTGSSPGAGKHRASGSPAPIDRSGRGL